MQKMGKDVITVDGKYYIIDDDSGDVKRVVIQDDADISKEEYKKILKLYTTQKK